MTTGNIAIGIIIGYVLGRFVGWILAEARTAPTMRDGETEEQMWDRWRRERNEPFDRYYKT